MGFRERYISKHNPKGKETNFFRDYSRALDNIQRIRESMNEAADIANADIEQVADDILPVIPDVDFTTTSLTGDEVFKSLYGSPTSIFRTRADYERTHRYINRINRAAESEWSSKDTNSLYGINTTLTAITDGDMQSEFMRRENQLATRNANRKAIEELKEKGINVVKVPVYRLNEETGELTTMYDRSRHAVFQYVPESPEQERRYNYAVQRDTSLIISQPAVPDNGYMLRWGDAVPVSKKSAPKVTQTKFLNSLREDEYSMDRDELYVRNMQAVLDTVLPDGLSDLFDEVFEDAYDLDEEEFGDFIDNLLNDPDFSDAVFDMDFLYLDTGISASGKLSNISDKLKDALPDSMNPDDYELFDYTTAEDFEDALGDSPLTSGQNIYAMYQDAKSNGNASSVTLSQLKRLRG